LSGHEPLPKLPGLILLVAPAPAGDGGRMGGRPLAGAIRAWVDEEATLASVNSPQEQT